MSGVVGALIVPGFPHPLLAPEAGPGPAALARGFAAARARVAAWAPDVLVLYSTGWPSVIGHQVQARAEATWTLVDPEFHALGSIPYTLRFDAPLATAWAAAARRRGLQARTVDYAGFPIDTGTVVALRLLDPDGRIPAVVVSCNMYADRAETVVLAKAAADALRAAGKRAVAVAVTSFTSRLHPEPVPLPEDRPASAREDAWTGKLLELLAEGRLEDVSQLARTFAAECAADSKLKAIWWLAALSGAHNRYQGAVLARAPIQGACTAVVALEPATRAAGGHEFDEEDVDTFHGDRSVLGGGAGAAGSSSGKDGGNIVSPVTPPSSPPRAAAPPPPVAPTPVAPTPVAPQPASVLHVDAAAAPAPVGAYPHARRVGDLLFLSGVGPRQPLTNEIPGGPVRAPDGAPLPYDAAAQTRACIENVRRILEAAGSSLDRVVDVTAFLIDMDRDFAAYNAVYAEYFTGIQAARTTLAIRALPTPIAVELKVVALAGPAAG